MLRRSERVESVGTSEQVNITKLERDEVWIVCFGIFPRAK